MPNPYWLHQAKPARLCAPRPNGRAPDVFARAAGPRTLPDKSTAAPIRPPVRSTSCGHHAHDGVQEAGHAPVRPRSRPARHREVNQGPSLDSALPANHSPPGCSGCGNLRAMARAIQWRSYPALHSVTRSTHVPTDAALVHLAPRVDGCATAYAQRAHPYDQPPAGQPWHGPVGSRWRLNAPPPPSVQRPCQRNAAHGHRQRQNHGALAQACPPNVERTCTMAPTNTQVNAAHAADA